jgi:hypothetical protein
MSPVMEDIDMDDKIVGFTQEDRNNLITVKLELHYIKQQIEDVASRTKELEVNKISIKELETIWTDIDEIRKARESLETRIKAVEDWKISTVGMFAGGQWVTNVIWVLIIFGINLLFFLLKK